MIQTPAYTTAQRLAEATNALGLDKGRLVERHRHLAEAPRTGGGGYYYQPLLTTLRQGLLAGRPTQFLHRLVQDCTPAQRRHFEPAAYGFIQLIDRHQVVGTVPAPRGFWTADSGRLTVNVTGLLGVRLATGETQAWRLHLTDEPLQARAADVPLILVDELLTIRGSHMTAAVVDVRRATVYKIENDRQRAQLHHLVLAEAEAYASLWNAAA